jgi:subtilisin family serine protease
MAQAQDPPDLVNLSFAGYVEAGADGIGKMDALGTAVQKLLKRDTIVVAAAGNDLQWAPAFPAALEGVIGVAALDEWGYPAPFTNYGPWVRACAVGMNLVSFFYNDFVDQDLKFFGYQGTHFQTGWARWTGTSFAAPQVVARLAIELGRGTGPKQAVETIIGSPDDKFRYPNFGTVVTAFEA